MSAAAPDRRQRRRQETVEQVLDVAVEVMAEQGVAGLTLGEVARRMGIRTPSLYGYFDGKNALYDALFERGWRRLGEAMSGLGGGADPVAELFRVSGAYTRWSVEHPAFAALMVWRPVPGFTPSAQAYAPAVALYRRSLGLLLRLQEHGAVRPDVDLQRAADAWTVLLSGVVSQQLANAPHAPFGTGAFTRLVPDVVQMWLTHFGPAGRPAPDRGGAAS